MIVRGGFGCELELTVAWSLLWDLRVTGEGGGVRFVGVGFRLVYLLQCGRGEGKGRGSEGGAGREEDLLIFLFVLVGRWRVGGWL